MTKVFSKALRIAVLMVTAAAAGFGQSAPKASAVPFPMGETLTFEGRLSKIFLGVSVADLVFSIDKVPGSDNYLIKTNAESKGTLLKIFRFSFLQQYESTVEPGTFRVVKTVKHDVQKDRVRDSEAAFDYEDKRVRYTETDPKDPNRAPRRIASVLDVSMNDIVSGIYSLRLMPLTIGKRFDMPVSDSGLVYNIPVRVTGRELQKTVLGKIWCYRVEPFVFGKGRLIEQDGSMIIWITDDERRLPIRSRIKTAYGRIDIKLKSMQAKPQP